MPSNGHIRSFTYTQNALDILKSSMLMQKISDKELLLQLTEIYEVLDGFKATMNGYYDMKDQVMTPFNLTLTDEQMHCLYEGDMRHGTSTFRIYRCETLLGLLIDILLPTI